jgi:hypothetical protein
MRIRKEKPKRAQVVMFYPRGVDCANLCEHFVDSDGKVVPEKVCAENSSTNLGELAVSSSNTKLGQKKYFAATNTDLPHYPSEQPLAARIASLL